MNMALDGLTVDFVKENHQANYDFLFRSRSEGEKETERASEKVGYDKRVQTLLNGVFRLLPSEGRLTRLHVRERKDSDSVSLYVPEFKY